MTVPLTICIFLKGEAHELKKKYKSEKKKKHSKYFTVTNLITINSINNTLFLRNLWTAIDRLSVIWKSNLTNKIKHSFCQVVVASILLHRCTTWTLTKHMEKKLDGNYTRMLRAVLNKSWRQRPTKLQMYGHQLPISKTGQVRQTRHAGHCWKSKGELISDILPWTPSNERAKVGRPARTYIQQLYANTRWGLEDLLGAMDNRDMQQKRFREIHVHSVTWWCIEN